MPCCCHCVGELPRQALLLEGGNLPEVQQWGVHRDQGTQAVLRTLLVELAAVHLMVVSRRDVGVNGAAHAVDSRITSTCWPADNLHIHPATLQEDHQLASNCGQVHTTDRSRRGRGQFVVCFVRVQWSDHWASTVCC